MTDPTEQFRAVQMEDQFDALMYLGPPSAITISQFPAARCADAGYMDTLLKRLALMPGPPGAPSQVDRLKQYCASLVPK